MAETAGRLPPAEPSKAEAAAPLPGSGPSAPTVGLGPRRSAAGALRLGLWLLLLLAYGALVYGLTVAGGLLLTGGADAGGRAGIPAPLNALAAALIALSWWPVATWLGNRVDDLVHGQHEDPYDLMSGLNAHLESATTPDALLPSIVATLAASLRLPYVAIEMDGGSGQAGPRAGLGAPPPPSDCISIPLAYRENRLGLLHVVARRPREGLSAGDARLLGDLARQVGITLHLSRLRDALQVSREQIVLAREEERRRIRRDLHDGLGPSLASLRLQLTALRHDLAHDPRAQGRIDELREDLRAMTADLRRLVYDLRPPMLDDLGLLGALRSLDRPGGPACRIELPAQLPPLPAAVEVAVYRIAVEALHNAARHGRAEGCIVRLETIRLDPEGDALILSVTDDGAGLPADYVAGIGHRSMQERAAELGGWVGICAAVHAGTCITASFPLKQVGHG